MSPRDYVFATIPIVMSLLSVLLPDMNPPPTIENASVSPEDALPIKDLEAYDDVIAKGLERGSERLAEAHAKAP